ncbi:sigma-70 family RNA polymerase sigma factor [Pendulispora rubella]|uniref:Sigma-70 family RNA polymerase sigma factor n=1 Tax=Pendulispora rubella TaxID=2741070 RepID=A0ABZ2L5Y7_9BACT
MERAKRRHSAQRRSTRRSDPRQRDRGAAVGGSAYGSPALTAPVETTWQGEVARARAALAEVDTHDPEFLAHVESCRLRGGKPEHAGDLVLAWGALKGIPAALRRFEEHVRADVDAAARRIDRAPEFGDEVRQGLRVRLLVPAPGERARMGEYAARGPLRAWVGVAALRVALNLKRASAPAAEDVLAEMTAGEPDAELRHLRKTYSKEFREALEGALGALAPRERALLRLCFVEGLTLVRIADLYGVHESTASRWVRKATDTVADDARQRLVARLSVSPGSVESIARLVGSQLELSVARLLTATNRPDS